MHQSKIKSVFENGFRRIHKASRDFIQFCLFIFMKTFLEIVDSSIINLAEMATNKIIKVSPFYKIHIKFIHSKVTYKDK